jgi:glycosyltransferase involved in cell wall biosynthesis
VRVLLVTHRYLPDGVTGIERVVQSLATELGRHGDDVSIFTRRPAPLHPQPQLVRERVNGRTRLYRAVGGDLALDRVLGDDDELERLFTQALVETAPDVVDVHHLIGMPSRLIERAARFGAAVCVSLHDFYFACPLAHLQKRAGGLCDGPDAGRECAATCFRDTPEAAVRWGTRTAYFRRLLSFADRVVCPSDYVASYFDAFAGIGAKTRVIPNGVASELLDPIPARRNGHAREPGELRIAFLGAVAPHKGIHLILDALAIAALPSAPVSVFGVVADPGYARTLRARAETIPGVRLQLHGAYKQGDLARLLAGADCVVSSSEVPESFSLTTREAFARGLPVVANRLGALPEAVRDGENGLLFAHDDAGELATALRALAFDGNLLARLSAGARATPITTAAQHAAAVRAVYDESLEHALLGGGPRESDLAELRFLHDAVLEVA